MSDVLLDPDAITLSLRRIANEVVERGHRAHRGRPAAPGSPLLIAIRRGGEPLATRIAAFAQELGTPLAVGVVDITFYRDDAATALPNPRIGPSRIPAPIDGRRVVLVDDVLHTGRTIRAAIDAVLDFGRPSTIELAVLIDRGQRELPIQPDYVGLTVDIAHPDRVEVVTKRIGPGPEDDEPWALLIRGGTR